ncbi:hypothetical protein BU23DRAFT_221361 [Bimuria novae-zelandiae CBS 107.79]|uniref:Uncharacterized protein n=1 Tax=Bimuria novae-zelandiae CBS 107.79 TaxID=1447943 RepID=A0A6A5VM15_9PLEO|nr:hypothetical protein BU23DRAFT_221361 [Bimuria novae-zelandiae CBS 107.79]
MQNLYVFVSSAGIRLADLLHWGSDQRCAFPLRFLTCGESTKHSILLRGSWKKEAASVFHRLRYGERVEANQNIGKRTCDRMRRRKVVPSGEVGVQYSRYAVSFCGARDIFSRQHWRSSLNERFSHHSKKQMKSAIPDSRTARTMSASVSDDTRRSRACAQRFELLS